MRVPGVGRNNFWFGTEEYSLWFPTPKSGADMGSVGWGIGGTTLNGGGWERQSSSTHKEYVFEWGDAGSYEWATLLKSFRSGVYGRGLLYFIDPLAYERNIFPERWAAPAIMAGDEGPSEVYGYTPESVPTSGWKANRLPNTSLYYDLTSVEEGYRGDRDTVYIPIPEGYTLYLGAFYSATGDGGIFASTVNGGLVGSETMLTALPAPSPVMVQDTFSGVDGVRVWVGKDGPTGTVTSTAKVARLYPSGATPPASFFSGPFIGGLGNSGCRFVGEPTFSVNTGVENGRVSFAATFREVGDWV